MRQRTYPICKSLWVWTSWQKDDLQPKAVDHRCKSTTSWTWNSYVPCNIRKKTNPWHVDLISYCEVDSIWNGVSCPPLVKPTSVNDCFIASNWIHCQALAFVRVQCWAIWTTDLCNCTAWSMVDLNFALRELCWARVVSVVFLSSGSFNLFDSGFRKELVYTSLCLPCAVQIGSGWQLTTT